MNEKLRIDISKAKPCIFLFLQMLAIGFLLWLTLLPVEVRWADANEMLCMGTPVIGIMGIICILLNNVKMKVTIVDGLVMIWTLYYVGRVWIGAEYPCGTDCLKVMGIILLYFTLRCVLNNTCLSVWWLVVGIIGCGTYEAAIGIYQMLTGTSRHHLFILTGTFQNPGPYSAYLMIAAIMGLYAIIFYKLDILYEIKIKSKYVFCYLYKLISKLKNTKSKDKAYSAIYSVANLHKILSRIVLSTFYFFSSLVLLPLLVLPATWSRAAFVGFGLCALWIYRNCYWKYRYFVWGGLAALAVAFYFIKRGSADGRTLIWIASLTSWMHDIWLGVGVGGFRNACTEGIAEMWNANPQSGIYGSAGVTDYSYNDLLKVLVEQGLIGVILCITTVVFALVRLYKQSKVLFLGMVSLIIFSMFSYPFELLPYTIIAIIVIAWSESVNNASLSLNISKIMCLFLCLITIAFSCCLKEEVSDRIEQDKNANLFASMQNAAFLTDYYKLLPYETDNPQYLFDFAKTLSSEKRYRDSNAILRKATLVSADPIFYIIMGNNYRNEQFYELAEESYNKAYAIMPNRLYPLYQIMMMYADIGEQAKAYDMAKVIRKSYVKIESKATQQMRQIADSIYYNGDIIQCPDKYINNKIFR